MNLLTRPPRFISISFLIFTLSGCGGGGSSNDSNSPVITISSISGVSTNSNSSNSTNSVSSSSRAAINLKYSIASGAGILQLDGTIVTWGERDPNGGAKGTDAALLRPPYFSPHFQNIIDFKQYIALKNDGKILVWGNTVKLASPTAPSLGYTDVPFEMPGISDVVSTASWGEGGSSFWAVKEDGSVYVWGSNYEGILGDGTNIYRFSPVIAPKLTNIKSISYPFAVRKDGSVLVWGPEAHSHSYDPIEVSGLTNIIDITTHLALKSDGTVYQRNEDRTGIAPISFTKVSELKDIVQIAGRSFALDANGYVFSWGEYNSYGDLGNGTNIGSEIPKKNEYLPEIVSIAAGYAVEADGTAYSWGVRNYGEIYLNSEPDYFPVKMPSPRHLQYITEFKASSYILSQGETAELSAESSSGLPITYREVDQDLCGVTGSKVTIYSPAAGSCDVIAMQKGSDDFVPADLAKIRINIKAKSSNGNGNGNGNAEAACAVQPYTGDSSNVQVYAYDYIAQFDQCAYRATGNTAYITDGNAQCKVLDGLLRSLQGATTFKPQYCNGPLLIR